MTTRQTQRLKYGLSAAIGVAVLAVFWPALHCGFILLDDGDYVTTNPNVQHGLTWASLRWAFTTGHAANWHPLTWVSHMIDCRFYGLNPMGHHLTSLLLHMASSVLLFTLLERMTGAIWRSAFVAAIFALHPLRVESVVWVAERKDALSTFFWMLTVGAYVRYVESRSVPGGKWKWYYALALCFFACGLMSKPMLVTLPFVLLLLDYWPLQRLGPFSVEAHPAEEARRFTLWQLTLEKLPFLALATGASIITFLVQDRAGVVESLAQLSLADRLGNIPVAYVRYLAKIFWPSGLAVFYGFDKWSHLQVSGACLLLLAVTVWVIIEIRKRPYLAVGWFWFLGVLVPTIGIVKVGHQAMADRFSYIPSIGFCIMLVWGWCDLAARQSWMVKPGAVAAVLAIAACVIMTPPQIEFWKTPEALFIRAADVSNQDAFTCYNIGCQVMEAGNFDRAARCFERALRAAGDDTPKSFRARVENNLGCSLLAQGQVAEAVSNFESALVLQPQFPQVYFNMGRAFLTNRQPEVAVECFQHALALDPGAADVHCKLANAYAQLGKTAEAIDQYSQALKLQPAMDEAAGNLAWILSTCPERSLRDGARAVKLAVEANARARGQNPAILAALAAAYAETGHRAEAVTTAQQARELALAENNRTLAGALEAQLRQYQAALGNSPP